MRTGIEHDTVLDVSLADLRASKTSPEWYADVPGIKPPLCPLHAGMKPQIIAHHHHEFLALRKIEHFAQGGHAGRDRLLHEHVPAALGAGANTGDMDRARCRDHD